MKSRLLITCCVGLLLLLTIVPVTSFAEVPQLINYQGYLTDLDGNPVPDKNYGMLFTIYDSSTKATPLWDEFQTVTVTKGIYNVHLGSVDPIGNPFPENLFDGQRWLGVTIEGEEMLPRQLLTSTPFALKAGDADTLAGYTLTDLDDSYVQEGETGAVNSTMIADGAISSADLASNSVGSSQVAANSLTADDLATNSVGSSEVADNSLTAADLAAGSVGSSEIAANAVGTSEILFPLYYIGVDANGGLWDMNNTNAGSDGNYPAAISGSADATPTTGSRIMGVMGLSPKLGSGAPVDILPAGRIGVAGATTDGHAVVGVCPNGVGVRGESSGYNGVEGISTGSGLADNGVYGETNSTSSGEAGVYGRSTDAACGVYGYSSSTGYGVRAYSANGDGIYSLTGAFDEHAGYFSSSYSVGLAGAALYARAYNTTGNGIAFWAHNDHTTSTDATAVLSNDGSGPLLEGFGGNGGEDEFRINNDGTMIFYNSSHETTLIIDPEEGSGGVGGQITLYDGDGTSTIQIDGDYNGDGRITTQELQITGGSDLSEQFDIHGDDVTIAPGLVVSIDPDKPGQLSVSDCAYDNKVAGIISGAGGIKPGMMMGQQGTEADGQHPVALTGRVYCWADATAGAIRPGDLLTTANLPGHAMKVNDHTRANGAILGKAMTALDDGTGLVLVLVSLQ